MFTKATHVHHLHTIGREHFWNIDGQENQQHNGILAGASLGAEILRVRFLRGTQFDETRYQLVDDAPGTLPYHSWVVTKGDELWPDYLEDADARALLEPYLHEFSFSPTAIRLTRSLNSDERIFGLGERTGDMNKRGQAFPIWNIDPHKGHDSHTMTMYTSVPFYLGLHGESARAYGVLLDHSGRVEADFGKTNASEATLTVEGDSLTVYYFAGPTPADVMRQYTALTGHMPLPARWTIGYHQCRWGYASAEQVLQIAHELRERHHPTDAIWLDIDYMDGYRNFKWNPQTFPHPEQMTQQLHEQGLRLVTIVDPGTKIDDNYFVYQQAMQNNSFCTYPDGTLFKGFVWPGACHFPDFSQGRVRAWWGNLYETFLDQGVDGIWNDMNEPALTNVMVPDEPEINKTNTMDDDVLHRAGGDDSTGPDGPPQLHKYYHNAYGMEMARSSYQGLSKLRPDSRPFVLTRSGTAGVQRYAAVWTGDNWSRYADILMAIPMCLNLSMSGIPFVGMDIGGFWETSNGELLVRFAQLGAFMPFCRNHNATGYPLQEPWAFGEPYESAYRKAIETRYQLMPYFYTLFHAASTTGAPVIRPLYYHYPQDELACDVQDAFLVGDALLSAPIYEEGVTSRQVYLPAGFWLDYWTGDEYPGNGWSEIPAPLDRWPLLIRGNSILPAGPLVQYANERPTDPLTFTCYMTTDGLANYTLYEDDGISQAYRNGTFAQTSVNCRVTDDFITVEIEERFQNYRPQREWYEVVVRVGSRVLRERVKAGQGKVVVHL
jgi:alpha-glucosidase